MVWAFRCRRLHQAVSSYAGLTNLDRLKAVSGLHDFSSDVGFGALRGRGRGKDESHSADTSVNWSRLLNWAGVNTACYPYHWHNILMASNSSAKNHHCQHLQLLGGRRIQSV